MRQSRDSAQPRFVPRSRIGRAGVILLCAVIAVLGARIIRQLTLWNETSVWPGTPESRTHSRPIVERDGHRFLWARGDSQTNDAEWFDVTDSAIDPEQFQYGIGKDTIASIDTPRFVAADDPRLRESGIGDETPVIGFVYDGDARAYPITILDEHELVNDTVGGKPVTVGW